MKKVTITTDLLKEMFRLEGDNLYRTRKFQEVAWPYWTELRDSASIFTKPARPGAYINFGQTRVRYRNIFCAVRDGTELTFDADIAESPAEAAEARSLLKAKRATVDTRVNALEVEVKRMRAIIERLGLDA